MIEFKMPNLGADMEHGILREWRKKPGDMVHRGDIIAEVETQKGIIEIEVFNEGVVQKLLLKVDEKVPVGTVMALIEGSETTTPVKAPPEKTKPEKKETKAEPVPQHKVTTIRISPLAKRMALEKGVDISTIKGTGEEGAITKSDIEKAVASGAGAAATNPSESVRMAVAAAMSRSNREIPHYYLETTVNMSKALGWLSFKNASRPVEKRLLPVALLIKAVASSLKEVPEMNAVWEEKLLLKEKINIGVVVSLRGGGIVVPAIPETDKKSPEEIMDALTDMIPRARAMKLRSSELSESTISVTSLGDNSADTVFGIIYPPQVALIGFGSITEKPWAENGMLGVRPVLHITLSADHRASDGHMGGRFLETIKTQLMNPEKL